tara:strand:- start:70707 stop:70826 length:120 start_codon:yes stop_codon:yes gene_type:complete
MYRSQNLFPKIDLNFINISSIAKIYMLKTQNAIYQIKLY